MAKGYIISDLHMMAHYSQANRYWPAIEQAASKADFFILNGDLNELYFSNLPFEQRIETAISHLEHFVRAHPKCQFHYIMGNHENIDAYLNAVVGLAHKLPNLHVHPSVYRMRNALFLHGDEPLNHRQITHERYFHSADGKKQKAAGVLLPIVNPLQAQYRNLRNMLYYSNQRDLHRILDALDKADPAIKEDIEHVFYAHTHRPRMAESVKHSPIQFHNTGAGVRGARFRMLEIEADEHDNVVAVHDVQLPDHSGDKHSLLGASHGWSR